MKQCPLCGAGCFEDMDTCYCCMYRFADASGEEESEDHAEDGRREVRKNAGRGGGVGCDAPNCRQETWFAGAGIRDEEPEPQGDEDGPAAVAAGELESTPCAFGPTIEHLPGVGRCVRIDIPLLAFRRMVEALASEPMPKTA